MFHHHDLISSKSEGFSGNLEAANKVGSSLYLCDKLSSCVHVVSLTQYWKQLNYIHIHVAQSEMLFLLLSHHSLWHARQLNSVMVSQDETIMPQINVLAKRDPNCLMLRSQPTGMKIFPCNWHLKIMSFTWLQGCHLSGLKFQIGKLRSYNHPLTYFDIIKFNKIIL